MKLQKKNLVTLLLLSKFLLLASCGQMKANLEHPSGAWEENSTVSTSQYLPGEPDPDFFAEASEATEVREVQEKKPTTVVKTESSQVDEQKNQTPPPQEPKKEQPPVTQTPAPKPSPKPTIAAPTQAEMNGPGVLKPTVYFFVVINEDKNSCAANAKSTLYGAGGKKLLTVCAKTLNACALQGSCAVVQNGKTHTFNVIGRFDGQDRFFEIEQDGCRFGYGVNSSCLDPFYTLAADLTIYKPGEVIFVPAVVGLELPDGSKHSGYFVIRDKGRGIIGRGRFDFFSGYFSWLDPKNPFNKLGLSDVSTNIPYFRVSGESAKKFLLSRAYPQIPANATGGPIK